MKQLMTVVMLFVLAISSHHAVAAIHQINISGFAFSPADLTVSEGDTVQWTNLDSAPHTVTASDGSFDSGYMGQNQSWSRVFSTAGDIAYYCYYHPGMTAMLHVEAAGPAPHEISIQSFMFMPQELTIQPGETVRWTNLDSAPHTATATDNSFDSGNLGNGQAYSHTFTTPGTYAYVCAYHSNMAGVIVVAGSTAQLHEVTIEQFAFHPQTLNIQPGDTVRWTNLDFAPHTATASDGSIDSGNLEAGNSFSYVFTTEGSVPYICLYHDNMTGVINVGETGGGNPEWVALESPTSLPLSDVRFWDEHLGWAAGEAGLLRTTDGGDSWTLTPTNDDVEAVYFVSATEGWLCGNDGMIQHSTDGGQSWTSQTSGVGEKLRDIWFTDSQNGWAVGRDGILIHTTNGGQNWNPQTSPATDDLRGIFFLDAFHGWIAGSDGLILHSHDGGQTWEAQLSVPGGEEDEFEAVFALDHEHVWAAGGQGRIYASTDGGESWAAQTSNTTVALMDIFFTSADTGWVCGAGGYLAMTTTSGEMWHPQTPPVFATFNAIYFVNPALGYLVAADGSMYRYAATPQGAEPHAGHGTVRGFELAANYPNPFNPATTIEFTVPSAGDVRLEVFDVLGRNVATLISGNLQAGQYRTQFSGANLASGRYFYRLQAAGQVQTRMMTLLK